MAVTPQDKLKKVISLAFTLFPFIVFLMMLLLNGNLKHALFGGVFFLPVSIFITFINKRRAENLNSNIKTRAAIMTIAEVKQITKITDDRYSALLDGTINNNGPEYKVQKEFYFNESDMRFLQPGNKLPVLINKKNKHEMEIMMDEWKNNLNNF